MNRIKIIALFLITFIIISSSAINIFRQYSALKEAKIKNKEVEKSLWKLKETNLRLKSQIEYATSSGYIEQQARDKFGLGSENDVWLILPPEKKSDSSNQAKNNDNKPVFLKWLELFTK